jgi:hypothetical protein
MRGKRGRVPLNTRKRETRPTVKPNGVKEGMRAGATWPGVGLLLLAADVPLLRRPVGHGTIWATERWRGAKGWYHRRGKRVEKNY